jgi:uncharacterized membrane protein
MADQIQLEKLGGAASNIRRLAYIDWLRGLACVLMFQAHSYSAWLTLQARSTQFYRWSQALATLPAPLFIFLAGVSSAMVTQKLREKGVARGHIARTSILRGAEILGLGLLFRLQEFALGYPKSPWTDLLRVDVLNILGLSMMLMGVLCWATAPLDIAAAKRPFTRITTMPAAAPTIIASALTALAIAIATPWLWTTHRLRWLPWPIESYINGVHTFAEPQTWLFPIFPWVAFGFAGLALGFLLFTDAAKTKQPLFFAAIAAVGMLICAASQFLDAWRPHLYPPAIYDYWHTSPEFFLMRCGVLLALMFLAYAWCRWGLAQRGFSPLIQFGNTSLLVYWVHIEFVYGRFSILPKGRCGILKATTGFVIIFGSMLALSVLRTRWKKKSAKVLRASPAQAAATQESG